MNRNSLYLVLLITLPMGSTALLAGGAVTHSGQASAHSMQTVGHTMVSGAKFVSGSAAVPFKASGHVGKVSFAAGNDLWEAAETPVGEPLSMTDEIYQIGPSPDRAFIQ
ncbi:MAG: hypothetical protein GY703_19735 [Gammaproteobacteria bacterium]|nr:hypothetical protein [Gammaproteobacteria bacterium]